MCSVNMKGPENRPSRDEVDLLLRKALASSPEAVIPDSQEFCRRIDCTHECLLGVALSLAADGVVRTEKKSVSSWCLTEEGKTITTEGSPEFRVWQAVKEAGPGGSTKGTLEITLGRHWANIGIGAAMKRRWIKKGKEGALIQGEGEGKGIDVTCGLLQTLAEGGDIPHESIMDLKRRKLVANTTVKFFVISRGHDFAMISKKRASDLTKDMLESGDWRSVEFKPYNFNTLGLPTGGGYFHPLLKVRAQFRRVLMDMGFEEMPTNRWIESSFWNFDSLFQPQSHPARDAHDTFFIKEPAEARRIPEDYAAIVKKTHEEGGFGSIGYRYNWKKPEAMRNLLRTHTTAISSQLLFRLGQETKASGRFYPKRYFSVDRVFRNETMDATHLCEFHQVEGLVADRNLCLGDLIGTIKSFFEKIGITEVRFKPAYNPYTEPSMEVFGYHPDLKCWTEIGNSGIFRPEMLRPMDLPEDVRVIAWGLSLERPTMIKYRINNIRDLFGHKASLRHTQHAPACRFDI